MSTTLEVENLSEDNKKSNFRSQRIKLNGKQATTPIKAIDGAKVGGKDAVSSKAHGLFEVFKQIGPERIEKLCKNDDALTEYSRGLRGTYAKAEQNELRMLFMKYDGEKAFPSSKENGLLTDLAHSYSDITPIPIVNVKIDDKNFQQYLNYIKEAYTLISRQNHKPIMGTIQMMPRDLLPKVLDYYLSVGINAVCIDFNGQTPDHLKMRPILTHLGGKNALENSLLYLLNTKYGRAQKNVPVLPAKDFVAYGYGADILGCSHTFPKLPKSIWDRLNMLSEKEKRKKNAKRIFIKKDYGYHTVGSRNELEAIYPKETAVRFERVLDSSQNDAKKLFNMEQQAIEATEIRKRLNSLDKKESILDYILTKEQAKKEIGHFKRKPIQSSLFQF